MLSPPRGHLVRPSISTPGSLSRPSQTARSAAAIDVPRAVSVMRRDGAAGQMHGFERMAAQEQQQHAMAVDVVSAQPLVAIDAGEPEHLFVERTGPFGRLDVERRFQNAEE